MFSASGLCQKATGSAAVGFSYTQCALQTACGEKAQWEGFIFQQGVGFWTNTELLCTNFH